MRQRLNDGQLHALINNARISPKGPNGERMNSMETDIDVWMQVFQVNFFAPIMSARGLVAKLKRGQGSIVNITSIAGTHVHRFAGAAYATSKAALAALTREMAGDFGPLGIRVNAVAPGAIETAILSPGTDGIVKELPLGRLGQPAEVVDTIYHLCAEYSSYVTGAEIHVNGGQHI